MTVSLGVLTAGRVTVPSTAKKFGLLETQDTVYVVPSNSIDVGNSIQSSAPVIPSTAGNVVTNANARSKRSATVSSAASTNA